MNKKFHGVPICHTVHQSPYVTTSLEVVLFLKQFYFSQDMDSMCFLFLLFSEAVNLFVKVLCYVAFCFRVLD